MNAQVSGVGHEIAQNGLATGHWVEVVSHTQAKYGGLSSAVPALSMALEGESDARVRMEAFCADGEATVPDEVPEGHIGFWPSSRRAWLSPRLRGHFREALRGADGVHVHGLWESSTAVTAKTCRELGIPYVLSAHGMLEPWALRSARLKKLLYSQLVERRNVRGATCLHALTLSEADQYRRFGARAPIAVIPNGVTLPVRSDSELFFNRFPDLRGKRILLFLARLHPKKGLDLLVDAWGSIASSWPEARLVLAGPDSEGTQGRLQNLIREKQLQHTVTFTGILRGDEKWSALRAAECFVLPSYSEGLSVSVLEAMGMGLPVIVTDACNMPEVEESRCGWQIPVNAGAVSTALHECLSHTSAENLLLGRRGADLIQARYTWSKVARQMAEVYGWIESGCEPRSVPLMRA